MTRPRIGITLDVEPPAPGSAGGLLQIMKLPEDYAKAVAKAGGMPLLLPWTRDVGLQREMIDQIDALLIPGGDDIDPKLYGQSPHPKTKQIGPDRTAFDLAMLSLAEARKLPTLGICFGCQLMNVHRGGTLHQHIPDVPRESPLVHSKPGDRMNAHEVTLQRGSKLAAIMGGGQLEKFSVNSRHHQAVASLGHELVATARASDNIIEAIEDPTLPFWLAVQWHPENLTNTLHERLFEALIKAAGVHKISEPQS